MSNQRERYLNGLPGSLLDGLPGQDEAREAILIAAQACHLVRDKMDL